MEERNGSRFLHLRAAFTGGQALLQYSWGSRGLGLRVVNPSYIVYEAIVFFDSVGPPLNLSQLVCQPHVRLLFPTAAADTATSTGAVLVIVVVVVVLLLLPCA